MLSYSEANELEGAQNGVRSFPLKSLEYLTLVIGSIPSLLFVRSVRGSHCPLGSELFVSLRVWAGIGELDLFLRACILCCCIC